MKPVVDLSGLDRLIGRANSLGTLNATPLMATWSKKIIPEDNRKGVLAGLDKDGKPMAPVTYRPVGKATRPTASQRNTSNSRARRGAFAGFGPLASGLHGNLSSSEYRKLGGPPLAPRGAFSRVITNLRTGFEQVSGNVWEAYGFWLDVVDAKGRMFLPYHFHGKGRQPRRDLCGVRPEGREKARKAAIAWLSDQVRWVAGGGVRAA